MFLSHSRCLLIATSLSITACSTVSVTTDYDHTATFSQYHSYTLAASSDLAMSPSSDAALRNTLRADLAKRGITEVSDNADLHVVRHVFSQDKLSVNPSRDWGYAGVPYRYGRYGMWAGAPMAYTDVSQYTEGTLILDFVDTKTNKLVFRGTGTGIVSSDPATNAARVQEAVEKIVNEIPGALVKP